VTISSQLRAELIDNHFRFFVNRRAYAGVEIDVIHDQCEPSQTSSHTGEISH
jgi:hypothetical protein